MKRSSSRFWWLVLFLTLLRPPSVPSWLGPAVPVDGAPCAVLVHPDQGLPALAAQGLVPVQWPEVGQQLLRRIQWDANGSSPVRVMALSEFCREMERCQVPGCGCASWLGMVSGIFRAEEASNHQANGSLLPVNIGNIVKCQNRGSSGSIDNLLAGFF